MQNFIHFLALMMESLKNNLVQACDGEKITLHCPRNTHILIENTFYGRLVPSTELCPSTAPNTFTLEDTSCDIAEAHTVGDILILHCFSDSINYSTRILLNIIFADF